MAYWLANGAHQHPFDQAVAGHMPSITNEKQWTSWDTFYANVTSELTEPGCMYSSCQGCYRNDTGMEETYEWQYTLTNGANVSMAAKLVLAHPSLDVAVLSALQWALQTRKADMMILNLGIWVGTSFPLNGSVSSMLRLYEYVFQKAEAMVAAQTPPHTRLVFKATTPSDFEWDDPRLGRRNATWSKVWPRVEPLVKGMAELYGFDYYDVAAVTRAGLAQRLKLLWDHFHVYPYLYHQFNDLLLNIVC